jgi:FG-GAP-like repeat
VLLGRAMAASVARPTSPPARIPAAVAVGDFDGVGPPDLAVANNGSSSVSVLLGKGEGTFSAPTDFNAGGGPESVAVGDFNADFGPDLAVVDKGGVSVLLGKGDGTFGGPTNFDAGDQPASVAVGDFNGDGHADLAVANASTSAIANLPASPRARWSG